MKFKSQCQGRRWCFRNHVFRYIIGKALRINIYEEAFIFSLQNMIYEFGIGIANIFLGFALIAFWKRALHMYTIYIPLFGTLVEFPAPVPSIVGVVDLWALLCYTLILVYIHVHEYSHRYLSFCVIYIIYSAYYNRGATGKI